MRRQLVLVGVDLAGDHADLAHIALAHDLDRAVDLGQDGLALGRTRLEDLLHTRQALRDVVGRGHAAGVEGAQRQLRARLADRLRRDNADRLADLDQFAGCQVAAIAHPANAVIALAR